MAQNPYTLVFGKEPQQMISRIVQSEQVEDAFCEETPTQQVFIITGVRGSGKTVFMTDISAKLRQRKEWIVIELNPEKDLLESLAAKLSSDHLLAKIFQNAQINLSFFGLGLAVSNIAPITDIEVALARMLESLKKQGKRLLVTIDEALSTESMRIFAGAFQIFVRQELPIYLLMTGLYENINALQNEKNLTFLYRAPKIALKPLNIGTICENYKRVLRLDEETALRMARLTKGYSFAFQVLGYLLWKNGGDADSVIQPYRQYLEEYAYEKIWSELSRNDRRVIYGIANVESGKIADIREFLDMQTNEFNPYRKRLLRKGLVDGDERGYVRCTLPLFEQFVLENYA